jgi:hypothetical protein
MKFPITLATRVTIKVTHYLNSMCLDAGFKIGVTRAIFPG